MGWPQIPWYWHLSISECNFKIRIENYSSLQKLSHFSIHFPSLSLFFFHSLSSFQGASVQFHAPLRNSRALLWLNSKLQSSCEMKSGRRLTNEPSCYFYVFNFSSAFPPPSHPLPPSPQSFSSFFFLVLYFLLYSPPVWKEAILYCTQETNECRGEGGNKSNKRRTLC